MCARDAGRIHLGCTLCILLLLLLRRTPGITPISTSLRRALMVSLCFAPVQVENFLYGLQDEAFFPGAAVVAAAALNLSRVPFCKKILGNLYSRVHSDVHIRERLLWGLAWPLPASNECISGGSRIRWYVTYAVSCAISISCYFIGYRRPSR